jgi:hypothetical protein
VNHPEVQRTIDSPLDNFKEVLYDVYLFIFKQNCTFRQTNDLKASKLITSLCLPLYSQQEVEASDQHPIQFKYHHDRQSAQRG